MTYYVYMLIDPRKNQPFYVGKGKDRRAKTHLWVVPETRNEYKENIIASIRANGLEPEIRYLVRNIIDESLAYEIEAVLIKYYGRKGYDRNGILANVCEDSRPPNHKGRTYEEIYGSKERADEQRKLRSRLQKHRGGYGPRNHSAETRRKLSEKRRGQKCNPCSAERRAKIGLANSKYRGEKNKKSHKWLLTAPDGTKHVTIGNLNEFLKSLGLPISTMHKILYSPGYNPKSGPAKDWKIESVARNDYTEI